MLDIGSAFLDLASERRDDLDDREAEALRESEVTLVVRGDGHDRSGPVVHQDVVGDPDRDAFVIHRVRRVEAGEDAGLLLVCRPLFRLHRHRVPHVGPQLLCMLGHAR